MQMLAQIKDRRSKHSLFGLLNYCVTPMASRLVRSSSEATSTRDAKPAQLRVNILAPLTDVETISHRLDAVRTICSCLISPHDRDRSKSCMRAIICSTPSSKRSLRAPSSPFFASRHSARHRLKGTDYDKLVGTLVSPNPISFAAQLPAIEAERKIAHLLSLRTLVRNLPSIRASLNGCHASLLTTIKEILQDPRPEGMKKAIDKTINEDTLQSLQKGAFAAKTTKVRNLARACHDFAERSA